MIENIQEPVSVSLISDSMKSAVIPHFIVWRKRVYKVDRLGLHYTYQKGKTLYHVFSIISQSVFMRLVLNTDTLSWQLEEIADGLPH